MTENKYICANRSPKYKERVEKVIQEEKKKILDFFNAEDDGKFNFTNYIYDSIDALKNG